MPHGTKPQLRVDARAQHGGIDRLGDEVIRPGFQTQDFAFLPAMAGEHDRRQLRNRRIRVHPQPLQHLRSVESRHVKVEQEERRNLGVQHLQRLRAVPRFSAMEASRGKRAHEESAAHRIIICDQNLFAVIIDHVLSLDSETGPAQAVYFFAANQAWAQARTAVQGLLINDCQPRDNELERTHARRNAYEIFHQPRAPHRFRSGLLRD